MNWKRDGNIITLTMTVDDWDRLSIVVGTALGAALQGMGLLSVSEILLFVAHINKGNPQFSESMTDREKT